MEPYWLNKRGEAQAGPLIAWWKALFGGSGDSAAEEGVSIDVVSQRYTKVYHQDMQALGVLEDYFIPTADRVAKAIYRTLEP